MSQILVVDDEVGIRELLSEILREEGHQVRLAQNASEARQIRGRVRPDLVLLDIWMPDTDGISLLKEWASTGQLTMPVVMMSGHGTIDTAVEATRIGAYAFLEKPIALQKLLSTVGTALKQGAPRPGVPAVLVTIGKSHAVQQSNTAWVAPEDLAVFDQAENNLVGQAAEGILYLRDIDTLSRSQQKSLLGQTLKLDRYNARLVSSTSAPLAELVAGGAFDPRLYALLAGVIVRVPALRERAEDAPELANLVLSRAIEAKEAAPRAFNTAALNALRNYHWPGNLVQLESVVKTVAQLTLGAEIGVADVTNAFATLEAPLPG